MRSRTVTGALLGALGFVALVLGASAFREAGAAAPPAYYATDAASAIVHDTVTGLIWQKTAVPPRHTFVDAQTYCLTLQLGGYTSGWRLPTVRELATLFDPSEPLVPQWDQSVFGTSGLGQLWSTTPVAAGANGEIWIFDLVGGSMAGALPGGLEGVLCVR